MPIQALICDFDGLSIDTECAVFAGWQELYAGGMRYVAVPGPLTRSMALPRTDLLLASLAELSLDEILERLG
jgi:beta-phosphoglucomutase-like phosphatase (HAD superfamily)